MSGQTIRILPRKDYDVSGMASASSTTTTVAREIDTSGWREIVLLARLHAATWSAAGQKVEVLVAPDGYTNEDPGLIWNFTATSVLNFTQGTDTAPADKNVSIAAPFGPLIQIQLKFSNPVGANPAFKPSISIDLNLKGE